jgi:2-oxoisovalerate/pyruvate ferredoxin oxidoreductase gamma subunit
MIQVIIHGRGGQGAVKAAQLLALAASLEGKYVQAFPYFGIERSGAPVEAYCRISDKTILLRSQVYEADYAIVLDASLLKAKEINAGKELIINSAISEKCASKACFFDATSIALKIFNKPIVSTAMLAAFACHTEVVKKDSLLEACKEFFSHEMLEKNVQVINEVFKKFKK